MIRSDVAANKLAVKTAFIDHFKQYKTIPGKSDLVKITGLSKSTVSKYYQEVDFKVDPCYKILTDDVIVSVYQAAVKDRNVAAMKLWFQVVEGWNEKNEVKHTGQILSTQPPVILKINASGVANIEQSKK